MGSLLRQLVSQKKPFPQPLSHFHQRFKEDRAHGSTLELLLILKEVCESFEKCYIVIDAVDECSKTTRRQVLQILNDLTSDAQLFVTSRPHSYDISQHFKSFEQIEVAASEADIWNYCINMMDANDNVLDLIDAKLKIEVADSVSKNAQGMYVGAESFILIWIMNYISSHQSLTAYQVLTTGSANAVDPGGYDPNSDSEVSTQSCRQSSTGFRGYHPTDQQ